MNRLETKRKTALAWAIAMSIGFPLGFFMIIFGFTREEKIIAMAAVGIVVTIISFYGMPLIWIRFGQLTYYKNLCKEILDGVRSVSMLAEVHNKDANVMANDVKTLIQKGYLSGYVILDNEKIIDKNSMSRHDYEALEAERTGNLRHAALAPPSHDCVDKRAAHVFVVDEVNPAEAHLFLVPPLVGTAVDDRRYAPHNLAAFESKEIVGLAKLERRVLFRRKRAEHIVVEVGHGVRAVFIKFVVEANKRFQFLL